MLVSVSRGRADSLSQANLLDQSERGVIRKLHNTYSSPNLR